MARTKKKPSKPVQPTSMHPKLHQDVLSLIQPHGLSFKFYPTPDEKHLKAKNTNIMGKFICKNKHCATNGWSSKKIAITIRLFRDNRYNATVYHQRCRSCNQLSSPKLDDSYADRVSYRLKAWSNIEMDEPEYTKRRGLPHRRELCEGCKANVCTEGYMD